MVKSKIGILVFSGPKQIKVGRDGRSNYSFDGIKKQGINKIIADLHGDVGYCSTATLNDYEHVLVSLTSYHDILNLINSVPINRKAKIHIGGPACNNINPILPFIDSANFGRCDNGKINRIIAGEKMESVWQKTGDPGFEGQYLVDVSSVAGLAGDEKSFGCRQKCAFCFYSHWNGHVSLEKGDHYRSGVGDYEDFFQSLDWQKAMRGAVTALDGTTEKTRLKVNKPIKYKDILNTLLESNDIQTKTRLRVKVYSIIGYPWESKNELEKLDLVSAAREIEDSLKNEITLRMHFSHFIPFQKTPMWKVAFNFNNYRSWCINRKKLYDSGKIRVFSGGVFTGGAASAAISTVMQRGSSCDLALIKHMASRKFRNMPSGGQMFFLRKNAMHLLGEQKAESIPNIKTPNAIKTLQQEGDNKS